MRKGLIVLGCVHTICIFFGLNVSVGFVLASVIAAGCSFWRAFRPKSNTCLEILSFVFMYLFISGLPYGGITDKQLIVWYILFAVLSVVFFVLCERKINGKYRVHKTKTSELSNLGSNIHPIPANNKSMSLSTPIVKNDSEQSVSLQIEPTRPL